MTLKTPFSALNGCTNRLHKNGFQIIIYNTQTNIIESLLIQLSCRKPSGFRHPTATFDKLRQAETILMFVLRADLKVFAELFFPRFFRLQLVEAVDTSSARAADAQITVAATDATTNHRSQVATVTKWIPCKIANFSSKTHDLFIWSCSLFIHRLPLPRYRIRGFSTN